MNNASIEPLLDRLRSGDSSAAGQLFSAFEPFLRGVVRRRMPSRAQGRFDSADIVQSAWTSLLDGFRQGKWQFQDEARLRAFLTRVVLYRLYDRAESALKQTRREEALDDLGDAIVGNESRPSEHARADAAWQSLLLHCPSEHRSILDLRRLGYSCEEIGTQTGLHPGSVRRILRQLARRVAFASPVAGLSEPVP